MATAVALERCLPWSGRNDTEDPLLMHLADGLSGLNDVDHIGRTLVDAPHLTLREGLLRNGVDENGPAQGHRQRGHSVVPSL